MTRQTLYKIHLWLSVPLGIFITLICLTGAILVFKTEIRNALGMPQVLAQHNIAKKHGVDHKLPTAARAEKHADHHRRADAPHGTTTKRDFFSYVTRLHTSLYMGPTGRLVVTYITLFFVVILISGVWICWPANGRQWKQRLSITRHKGTRPLMYSLHVALGFYALLLLIVLALTGASMGLHLVPKGTIAMKVVHIIHVGKWAGLLSKTITFVASLIGASLPLTGYYLYYKKHCSKK